MVCSKYIQIFTVCMLGNWQGRVCVLFLCSVCNCHNPRTSTLFYLENIFPKAKYNYYCKSSTVTSDSNDSHSQPPRCLHMRFRERLSCALRSLG